MPKAVVDGSNVAHEHRTQDGKPRVANLTAVCDALEAEGFDVMIIDGHVELHEDELAEARQKVGDLVDKMAEDSFPASDPPSY